MQKYTRYEQGQGQGQGQRQGYAYIYPMIDYNKMTTANRKLYKQQALGKYNNECTFQGPKIVVSCKKISQTVTKMLYSTIEEIMTQRLYERYTELSLQIHTRKCYLYKRVGLNQNATSKCVVCDKRKLQKRLHQIQDLVHCSLNANSQLQVPNKPVLDQLARILPGFILILSMSTIKYYHFLLYQCTPNKDRRYITKSCACRSMVQMHKISQKIQNHIERLAYILLTKLYFLHNLTFRKQRVKKL
eukprot:TRINITY_DN7445_c2_g1_i6.p4 TRINITY_DN7445_c2_g1~~TRINITY_DN7445_c2_g1_i6.p4  ORF type:complete len:245 (+),score=-9.08 TRINITY_DN7445_c2_g1_i6:2180-2914(+)